MINLLKWIENILTIKSWDLLWFTDTIVEFLKYKSCMSVFPDLNIVEF
jgi:hypothetical protein